MKKTNQSMINYERLSRNLSKENQLNECLENMLINDIKQVLSSYFIYQNDDVRYLFSENCGKQEFTIILQYRRVKDIKIL